MRLSVHVTFLVIGAGLLFSAISEVSAQDVPYEEECTPMAIAGCYTLYGTMLWNAALAPDHDDHFNNTAFYIACSEMKEKSSCHKTTDKCPQKVGMNLSRQEKGYQLMRDFICDAELLKDFRRALRCEDDEKMRKCQPSPPEELEQAPFDPNGQRCRYTISGWVCREDSLHPECIATLSRAKESYSKAREAVALLTGCDYEPSEAPSAAPPSGAHPSMAPSSVPPPSVAYSSAAPSPGPSSSEAPSSVPPPSLAPPSVAPLGFFLYLTTLSLLRWIYSG